MTCRSCRWVGRRSRKQKEKAASDGVENRVVFWQERPPRVRRSQARRDAHQAPASRVPTFCSFRVNRSLSLVLIRRSLAALKTADSISLPSPLAQSSLIETRPSGLPSSPDHNPTLGSAIETASHPRAQLSGQRPCHKRRSNRVATRLERHSALDHTRSSRSACTLTLGATMP
jgi:hypothetical protein